MNFCSKFPKNWWRTVIFLIKVEKVLRTRTNLTIHVLLYYGFISAIQIEMSVSEIRCLPGISYQAGGGGENQFVAYAEIPYFVVYIQIEWLQS